MSSVITIPTLETDRLILRAPRLDDWPACERFMDSDRSRYMGGPAPDRWSAWKSFCHLTSGWLLRGCGTLVLERRDTGATIGDAGPWQPVTWPEPELAWSIWDAGAEGRGYMAEAMRRIHAWAFDELGWETCVSYIDVANHRSEALAQRLGAAIDPEAALPEGDDPARTRVWRHRMGAA